MIMILYCDVIGSLVEFVKKEWIIASLRSNEKMQTGDLFLVNILQFTFPGKLLSIDWLDCFVKITCYLRTFNYLIIISNSLNLNYIICQCKKIFKQKKTGLFLKELLRFSGCAFDSLRDTSK